MSSSSSSVPPCSSSERSSGPDSPAAGVGEASSKIGCWGGSSSSAAIAPAFHAFVPSRSQQRAAIVVLLAGCAPAVLAGCAAHVPTSPQRCGPGPARGGVYLRGFDSPVFCCWGFLAMWAAVHCVCFFPGRFFASAVPYPRVPVAHRDPLSLASTPPCMLWVGGGDGERWRRGAFCGRSTRCGASGLGAAGWQHRDWRRGAGCSVYPRPAALRRLLIHRLPQARGVRSRGRWGAGGSRPPRRAAPAADSLPPPPPTLRDRGSTGER
jgi:hypothetical protein